MSKIYALTTVYEGLELLPHFLDHYTRLGVDEILVAVGYRHDEDFLSGRHTARNILPQAISMCRGFPARAYPFTYDQYSVRLNAPLRRAIKAEAGVQPDDWCLHADLDEFYTFPAPLRDIIRMMEVKNDWALAGWIIDRVAHDGSLPAIKPTPSIGEQFPIGCDLTGRLLRANVRKIMLCRGRVRVNGSHDNTENAYFDRVPIGKKGDYIAHHFKWNASLEKRLRTRIAESGIGEVYRRECNDLISYWEKHGRLPVDDPAYGGREMGCLTYPAETVVRDGLTEARQLPIEPQFKLATISSNREAQRNVLGIAIPAGTEIPHPTIRRCYQSIVDAHISGPFRVEVHRDVTTPFNLARARNAAIIKLVPHCDVILCLDADVLVPPGLIEQAMRLVDVGTAVVARVRDIDSFDGQYRWDEWKSQPLRHHGSGAFVMMTLQDWLRLGGWDERCHGWGGEDHVLDRKRQEAGIKTHILTDHPLVHVAHAFRNAFGGRRGHENLRACQGPTPRNYLTGKAALPDYGRHLHLWVTASCSGGCTHCSQLPLRRHEPAYSMSLEEVRRLVEVHRHSGYPKYEDIIITGGEPLQWQHLPEATQVLAEADIGPIRLFTAAVGSLDLALDAAKWITQIRISNYGRNERQVTEIKQRLPGKTQIIGAPYHFSLPTARYGTEVLPANCNGCQGPMLYNNYVFPCACVASVAAQLTGDPMAAPHCELVPGYLEMTLRHLHKLDEWCSACVANLHLRRWLIEAPTCDAV